MSNLLILLISILGAIRDVSKVDLLTQPYKKAKSSLTFLTLKDKPETTTQSFFKAIVFQILSPYIFPPFTKTSGVIASSTHAEVSPRLNINPFSEYKLIVSCFLQILYYAQL